MGIAGIVGGVVAFALVAGYAALAWLRHGRDPRYGDDSSIILPAPPPAMTAATATIVNGGATPVAFMAALLDLASRDEIRFRDEGSVGGRDLVGIEIRGGETKDAQVLLNRRAPVGEGEAWLLTQLKEALILPDMQAAFRTGAGGTSSEVPSPQMMRAMAGGMGAFLQFAAFTGNESDEAAAVLQHEHGMFSGAPPDAETLARSYEARTGRPVSDGARRSLASMALMSQLMADPAAIAADPEGTAAMIAARTGRQLTPEDVTRMAAWAGAMAAATPAAAGAGAVPGSGAIPGAVPGSGVAPGPAGTSGSSVVSSAGVAPGSGLGAASMPGAIQAPEPGGAPGAVAPGAAQYIGGQRALTLGAPLLFGTFLEQYAIRHGWLAGLPALRRIRWRLTGALEVLVALVLLAVGSNASVDAVIGIGIGVGAGGLATWLIAPAMPSRTAEGALMRAQLAAYRRTLQMTFAQSRSMNAAVTASGLNWLQTPDQALVWGIALGLRSDVEALMARTAEDMGAGQAPTGTYVPSWYDRVAGRFAGRVGTVATSAGTSADGAQAAEPIPGALTDPAAMFAGIEAIGSQAQSLLSSGGRPNPR